MTDDPAFGWVNRDGKIQDIMELAKIENLKHRMEGLKTCPAGEIKTDSLIVYGSGAAIDELTDSCDLIYYFDMTRQPLLWKMWDGKLVPLGCIEEDNTYLWKEYYYCDYYLLHHQKNHVIKNMDFYVEAIEFNDLKLVPSEAYDEIIQTIVKYPVKEVKFFSRVPGVHIGIRIFLKFPAWNVTHGMNWSGRSLVFLLMWAGKGC